MRTVNDYMNLPYRLEIIPDMEEGGYVVSYPELKGCLSSGSTIDEAVHNAEDAKREWLTAALEDDIDIPVPDDDNDFSGQFKLRIPKSLHRQLAFNAKREGVSMNQYCVYLLSQYNAVHNN